MMNTEITSRRILLRGALAAGCSLLLPGVLSGCSPKQDQNTTPPTGMEPATPAVPGKKTQAEVQYQAQQKGDLKCRDCMHFVAESSTCQQVEGQVSPDGWCVLWARKS